MAVPSKIEYLVTQLRGVFVNLPTVGMRNPALKPPKELRHWPFRYVKTSQFGA
jgi:hypothetical protein